jgi:hypothetical protein
MDWAKILSVVPGLIGMFLGVYNFIHTRRKERHEQQQTESDLRKYFAVQLMMRTEGADFFPAANDTEEQRWAERMVLKGLLERALAGGYALPRGK